MQSIKSNGMHRCLIKPQIVLDCRTTTVVSVHRKKPQTPQDRFVEHFNHMFDAVLSDALRIFTIPENKAFLVAQR